MKDFKDTFNNLAPRIRGMAAKIAFIYSNCKPMISEEDLYQEMCLWLWQNYRDGVPSGINDAYIVQGCKFHIKNFIRKTKDKYLKVSLDQPINPQGQTLKDFIPQEEGTFLNKVERNLLRERVFNGEFSIKEKKIFSLLEKNLTMRQIGKELNMSHVMVLKHKKKILEKISDKMVTKKR